MLRGSHSQTVAAQSHEHCATVRPFCDAETSALPKARAESRSAVEASQRHNRSPAEPRAGVPDVGGPVRVPTRPVSGPRRTTQRDATRDASRPRGAGARRAGSSLETLERRDRRTPVAANTTRDGRDSLSAEVRGPVAARRGVG